MPQWSHTWGTYPFPKGIKIKQRQAEPQAGQAAPPAHSPLQLALFCHSPVHPTPQPVPLYLNLHFICDLLTRSSAVVAGNRNLPQILRQTFFQGRESAAVLLVLVHQTCQELWMKTLQWYELCQSPGTAIHLQRNCTPTVLCVKIPCI